MIKIKENSLSESVNLFKGLDVIDIRTKLFRQFRRFVPREKNWFELSGVSRNRGFEKSGVKLESSSEVNPRETRFGSRYREIRETEGSRNQDSTVSLRFCD